MKKIISLLIACVISIHPISGFATGEYYAEKEHAKFNIDELVYKKIDISDMEKPVSEIEKLVGLRAQKNKVKKLLSDVVDFYCEACNQYAIATLLYDRSTTDKNLDNLNEISGIAVDSASLLSRAICAVYESQYSDILADVFGDIDTALFYTLPDDPEIKDLLAREAELTNQYNEIYGDSDKCAQIFCELVQIRNEFAVKTGYDNYAEYADDVIYARDCTDEELAQLYNGVIAHFKPLYQEAAEALNMIERAPFKATHDDVLLDTRAVMGKLNGELLGSFDYMIANNLYDIKYHEGKNQGAGAYTVYMPKAELPFLYINPIEDFSQDSATSVQYLIHEFGHFTSMLNTASERYGGVFSSECVETCEVQSQGLELLCEAFYGDLFGDAAPYQRYCLILNIVFAVVSGCYFDEWQTKVYEMQEPTLDKINQLAKELGVKYMGIDFAIPDAQEFWTSVPHNFVMPMYYLSYALSGITALELYSQSISDYDSATDKYMRISSEGTYKDFDELLDEYGFADIYDVSAIERIANSIESMFALGYPDVRRDAWYMPYVYTASNFIHGRAENTFMPDIPITRSEFVGALGRMYDYYEGIDKDYENTFSDIGTGDENTDYIAWASGEGIVSGYDDTTFGGNDLLTREQASAIIHRLDAGKAETETDIEFSDFAEVSDWAKPSVVWAAESGLINGRDNNEFCPDDNITRAETAKILSCYLQYKW